jgi:hypothetical protein
MAKARKPGRKPLPKGWAKSHILPVRFTGDDIKAMEAKARENKQLLSEWVRDTLKAALHHQNADTSIKR